MGDDDFDDFAEGDDDDFGEFDEAEIDVEPAAPESKGPVEAPLVSIVLSSQNISERSQTLTRQRRRH